MNDGALCGTFVRIRFGCTKRDGTSPTRIDETLALTYGGRLVGRAGVEI